MLSNIEPERIHENQTGVLTCELADKTQEGAYELWFDPREKIFEDGRETITVAMEFGFTYGIDVNFPKANKYTLQFKKDEGAQQTGTDVTVLPPVFPFIVQVQPDPIHDNEGGILNLRLAPDV